MSKFKIGDEVKIVGLKFVSQYEPQSGDLGVIDNIVEPECCIVANQDWQGLEYGPGRVSIPNCFLEEI